MQLREKVSRKLGAKAVGKSVSVGVASLCLRGRSRAKGSHREQSKEQPGAGAAGFSEARGGEVSGRAQVSFLRKVDSSPMLASRLASPFQAQFLELGLLLLS